MKTPDQPDYVVAVVGCGAMGQGIAQVSAQGGMRTLLFDAREGGAAHGRDQISKRLDRLVEKGRMGEAEVAEVLARLEPVESLAGLASADAVAEAIFEDLDVKESLLRELEGVVSSDCLLASNTSSIPLASIARACEHRHRIAGLHFFNPVPLMKLVEVIRPAEASDEAIANLMALGRRMTRTPVEVKDSPGFLVNMGGRAYTTEGLRLEHEGVARPEQVDAIMRDCWGFRMGPFELMDLTGIDVNFPVSNIVYNGYMQDPRIRTAPNHAAKFDAGQFGRKSGQGWFAYDGGKPSERPSPDFTTDALPVAEVRMAGQNPALKAFCDEVGLKVGESGPVLAAPVGLDATSVAVSAKIDPKDLLCVDLSGDTSKRVTVMTAPGADTAALASVAATIITSGRAVTWINDSPGFVGQRMVAMVGNLGCYMAEIGLASPEDIDTAMQLGLNYPHGSVAIVDQLGLAATLRVLETAQQITGEDRYRPTTWLRRRALLGLPIHTPN
ncbi:MAG: 3-hydroxyacyl-CoA dehydrogenase [Pseudomonadota bacterium]